MAKKNTTGGPTRRKRASEQEERSYLSRAERESRAQKWLLIAIAATLAVMLITLVVGIVYESLIYPNQAVAVVDGVSISTTDFEQRVRYERWALGEQLQNIAAVYGSSMLYDESSPFYQSFVQLQPGQEYIIGRQTRDAMVEELLIQAAAEELGVTVTEDEVEARIQEYFGYDLTPEEEAAVDDSDTEAEESNDIEAVDAEAEESSDAEAADAESEEETTDAEEADAEAEEEAADAEEETAESEDAEEPEATATEAAEVESTPLPTVTPAPTLSPEELTERYESVSTEYFEEAVKVSGMSEAEIRAIFATDILREELSTEVVGEIETTEEQVNARHILVSTEEEAQDILTALVDGQSFEDLAAEFSIDTGSAESGGELGWAGRGTYVTEFEDAIFTGEVGDIIGPVQTQYGYHIIEILGHEDRELTESEIASKESTAFSTWLNERELAATIEYPNDYLDRTPSDPSIYDMNLAGTVSQ